MCEDKTFLLLKYGSMLNAAKAYNRSEDRDAEFEFDAQCMIEGWAMVNNFVIIKVFRQNTWNPLTCDR